MIGRLIIISSPSGGGKGTLIKEVRGIMPELGYSVSYTTRAQRFGEEDGREYHFVSREEFERMINDGEFLEFAEVHRNLYGTSLRDTTRILESGKDLIVEVDVQGAININGVLKDQGARQLMEKLANPSISIFILPPSFEVLKARLKSRGTESDEELDVRLRNAFNEVEQFVNFKYVVVNEELPIATRQIAAIILAERQLLDRQTEAVRGILDSFDASKHLYS